MNIPLGGSQKKSAFLFSLLVILILILVQLVVKKATLSESFKNVLGVNFELPYVVPSPSSLAADEAVVVRVIDGDTIELSDGRKVRYIGMDTPETSHPTKGVECFGYEAKKKNEELVLHKKIKMVKDVSEVDRYQRLLRYVYVDEMFVNRQLVLEGYAFARSYPPDITQQEQLVVAENQARTQKLGLWGGCEINR